MKRMFVLIVVLALPMTGAQALEVFACEPEWGALTRELAGERAEITVATTAFQDPHRLQARPSLIAAMRNADILVCTGADLEIGWLPLLLRRAGNPRIQQGQPGHFLAADFVRKIEIPARIDRAQGDIHPQGNPHIHLRPRNIERVAKALGEHLMAIDPVNATDYGERLEDFLARWEEASDEWTMRAENLEGLRLASHHRSFSYLADWLDLDIVATLEPKPGIPPSGSYLAELLERLSPRPPAAVIRTPYANEKPSLWLTERLDVPATVLPYTVGGNDESTDLFGLYESTLNMLEALRQ
ncbi:MAG: zinc ABC transporter substrate-binding protein [Gammaproteobacteria bacterium]|nr:MAG: zinc ABC transporter substrate-binding protein [Gammaproteobacteria bacterium]